MNKLVLLLSALACTRAMPVAQQQKAINLDFCSLCEKGAEDMVNDLLNYIANAGIAGGCDALCGSLTNQVEAEICTFGCSYLGITAFSDLVQKLNINPDNLCFDIHICSNTTEVTHEAQRIAQVYEINSDPESTWKAGYNTRFMGAPVGASKSLVGVKPESKDMLKAAIAEGKVEVQEGSWKNSDLPEEFDSVANWPQCATVIGDIRDQSACGCCWAFGAAEAASDRLCISTNGTIALPLSAQETCFCASSDGCGGGDLYTPWSYIQQEGLVTGGQVDGTGPFGSGLCSDFSLPHCHHHGPDGHGGDPYPDEGTTGCPNVNESPQCPNKCDSSATAPHNVFKSDKYTFDGQVSSYSSVQAIAEAIYNDGPVEAAFDVYADFENYVSGVYQHKTGSMMGGHAIRIVGWGNDNGVKYWKVANSWNKYYGENGYFRILRGSDECGIEDQVTASSKGAKWHLK